MTPALTVLLHCNVLVLTSYSTDGYASVSTVNTDFITGTTGKLPEDTLLLAAHYAPLDGINEKGANPSPNGSLPAHICRRRTSA